MVTRLLQLDSRGEMFGAVMGLLRGSEGGEAMRLQYALQVGQPRGCDLGVGGKNDACGRGGDGAGVTECEKRRDFGAAGECVGTPVWIVGGRNGRGNARAEDADSAGGAADGELPPEEGVRTDGDGGTGTGAAAGRRAARDSRVCCEDEEFVADDSLGCLLRDT